MANTTLQYRPHQDTSKLLYRRHVCANNIVRARPIRRLLRAPLRIDTVEYNVEVHLNERLEMLASSRSYVDVKS
jgi:hypothetical protein